MTLSYDDGIPTDAEDALTALFARPSLVVEKFGKKGTTELDIAPMIRNLTVSQTCENTEAGFLASLGMTKAERASALTVEAVVAAQNPTLNPLLLATAIETHLPMYKPDFVQCRRLEIYDADGAVFR